MGRWYIPVNLLNERRGQNVIYNLLNTLSDFTHNIA